VAVRRGGVEERELHGGGGHWWRQAGRWRGLGSGGSEL
jgi:hypothetical protein